ncbi:LysR family transcriptional regulator [Sphingosinicellaceae bacterium]|nr:LysR family transcriptional regulator [Sphingosinicellaceae bacterium]
MKRTHLPLNALRVFDAAARHLSFTKAADELAVTPAAVGQQIRALEDTLGVVLFKRMTRNLELTPEASLALPALRAGFLQFEESVRILQDAQGSKVLTIAAPRDFTAKWLAARLAAYAKDHADTRFVLAAHDGGVDFTQANLDLAVVYGGEPTEEGVHGRIIAVETLVEVGAPGTPADALRIVHPGDVRPGGLTVGDAGLALDAAALGFGIAQVPATLAAADLAAGRVVAIGEPEATTDAYWLLAPTPQWRQAKVRALVEFLLA